MKCIILTVFFLVLTHISTTDSSISTVLTILQKGYDVFKLGFQIVDLIRKQNAGTFGELSNQIKAIRDDMENMIQASTTRIIEQITLLNKLDKIESIVNEIKSLLIDLENYVLEENEAAKLGYKTLFISRFDQRVVAMIRSLPSLLTYSVPGLSVPLKDLIVNKADCNMTAIHDFQKFYARLLSDGPTLQLVFRELSNLPSEDVEKFWSEQVPQIQRQFDRMETTCKSRFPKSAEAEVKQTVSASVLYKNCKERYTWAWCDVFFYPPMGTHQFHYHTSTKDFMFWNGASSSGKNQLMVIGELDNIDESWKTNDIASELQSSKTQFKSLITDPEDTSAAKKIGDAVKNSITDKGLSVGAVVVFFDSEELGTVSTVTDDTGPAAYVSVEDITLKYCYHSSFVCTITRWNLFNFNDDWKVEIGKFHVYVFPCSSVSQSGCSKHSTSAAGSFRLQLPNISLCACMTTLIFLITFS